MPTPKRKTSKSRRDKRASGKFISPKAVVNCSQCEAPLSPHQACYQCGFYKGKKVITTKLERALKRGEARSKKQKEQIQEEKMQASKVTEEASIDNNKDK